MTIWPRRFSSETKSEDEGVAAALRRGRAMKSQPKSARPRGETPALGGCVVASRSQCAGIASLGAPRSRANLGSPDGHLIPCRALIGRIRREFLDQVLFWNARDLERKLADFQTYYNAARRHAPLNGHTPMTFTDGHVVAPADLNHVRWVSHCRDLVQLPAAA